MSAYAALLACIRSGQLSEAQIADAMRDRVFVAYWRADAAAAGASK